MSAEDRERFDRDGYVIGPAIASPTEMAAARRAIEAVLATPGPAPHPNVHRHLDSPAVHHLCAHLLVVERVSAILGPDVLLWHSRLFDKPPGGEPIPWHQDMAFWSLDPQVAVSVWIALDRADRQNACVEVVPGSHDRPLPHLECATTARFRQQADPALVDATGARAVELDPGQTLLFHPGLLHSSAANRSNRPRLALSARYVPTRVAIDFDAMSPQPAAIGAHLVAGVDTHGRNPLLRPPA